MCVYHTFFKHELPVQLTKTSLFSSRVRLLVDQVVDKPHFRQLKRLLWPMTVAAVCVLDLQKYPPKCSFRYFRYFQPLTSWNFQHDNLPDTYIEISMMWTVLLRYFYLYLVGGLNPSEKYEFVNWDDYSQYIGKWNMFQTTNQLLYNTMGAKVLFVLLQSVRHIDLLLTFESNPGMHHAFLPKVREKSHTFGI